MKAEESLIDGLAKEKESGEAKLSLAQNALKVHIGSSDE